MNLTKEDYIKILNYYNINYYKKSSKYIKRKAESILADKLCKCIKKVNNNNNNNNNNNDNNDNSDESRAIGICKNSVLTKKHLTVGKFSCKKRPRFSTTLKKRKK